MGQLLDAVNAVGGKVDKLETTLSTVKTDAEQVIAMLSGSNPDNAAAIAALQAIGQKIDDAQTNAEATATELAGAAGTAASPPAAS